MPPATPEDVPSAATEDMTSAATRDMSSACLLRHCRGGAWTLAELATNENRTETVNGEEGDGEGGRVFPQRETYE